ncbi:MAG: hypothetical protein EBU88_08530 [Acidobacteria bacterium]|nr:hypothetical protein [Acidobacteriota bacterium]
MPKVQAQGENLGIHLGHLLLQYLARDFGLATSGDRIGRIARREKELVGQLEAVDILSAGVRSSARES